MKGLPANVWRSPTNGVTCPYVNCTFMAPFHFLLLLSALIAPDSVSATKINGVNFVAPVKAVPASCMMPVKDLNAGWVALNPYAFVKKGQPEVTFNHNGHWWGERPEGIRTCIEHAHQQGLKVMVKPHVWVAGQGWAGDFTLDNEADWQRWETTYTQYVLTLADLAKAANADMFCVGTEFRQVTRQRPAYWKGLIQQVRAHYGGPLTYAANWDEYERISFWPLLDYVGVDAYFPLSESDTPGIAELMVAWKKPAKRLQAFSQKHKKSILFTEFGYRSVDRTAGKQWELPDSWNQKAPVNLVAQQNAYAALFRTFWQQPWFAGGFLWKWYEDNDKAGGPQNDDYTPQRKPAEALIRQQYGQ